MRIRAEPASLMGVVVVCVEWGRGSLRDTTGERLKEEMLKVELKKKP